MILDGKKETQESIDRIYRIMNEVYQSYHTKGLIGVINQKAGFDPNQPRDKDGQWSSTGGSWHKIDLKEQLDVHYSSEPQGSTFDPITGKNLAWSKGKFSVSINLDESWNPEKIGENLTKTNLKEYLDKYKDVFLKGDKAMGTWYGAGEGEPLELWLDIATIVDSKEEAIKLAEKYNQVGIFDLERMKYIPTGGTGKKNLDTDKEVNARKEWDKYMRAITKGRKSKK